MQKKSQKITIFKTCNRSPVQNVLCDFLKVRKGQEKSGTSYQPTRNAKNHHCNRCCLDSKIRFITINNNYNNIYLDINKGIFRARTGKNGRKIKEKVPKVERHYKQKDNKKGKIL